MYTHDDINVTNSLQHFVLVSPEYSLAYSLASSPRCSPETPTPSIEPPLELLLRGTIATRRGAPPLFFSTGGGSSSAAVEAPPIFDPKLAAPLPPAPRSLDFPTAATAANVRPGLNRGHMVPTGSSTGGEAARPTPSDEGDA
ncbi:unnamed protein product [Urochloa humidicola]